MKDLRRSTYLKCGFLPKKLFLYQLWCLVEPYSGLVRVGERFRTFYAFIVAILWFESSTHTIVTATGRKTTRIGFLVVLVDHFSQLLGNNFTQCVPDLLFGVFLSSVTLTTASKVVIDIYGLCTIG